MHRRFACAAVVLVLATGVALADDLVGVIKTLDADKLTLTFTEGKKGAEPKNYDIARDVKVFKMVAKDKKELSPDGLKTEPFPKLPKGGAYAVIKVEDGKVTEISVPTKPKKN